jgi:UPF0716 family protein affecting phage T7 exclusion
MLFLWVSAILGALVVLNLVALGALVGTRRVLSRRRSRKLMQTVDEEPTVDNEGSPRVTNR